MLDLQDLLPEELLEIISNHEVTKLDYNITEAQIFYCRSKNNNNLENYYLKILPLSIITGGCLQDEKNRQEWLKKNSELPIPHVVYFDRNKDYEFILTTEIEGTPVYKLPMSQRKEAVIILAKTLKRIHSTPIEKCPFNVSLDVILPRIKERIEDGTIDEKLVNKYRIAGKKVAEVYQELLVDEKPKEDLVFCHGDYCLPNILVQNNSLTGIIDWGYAGIADRYQDISMCSWSIGYNFKENGEELKELFHKEYGIEKLDEKKIRYFRLLSDFFAW